MRCVGTLSVIIWVSLTNERITDQKVKVEASDGVSKTVDKVAKIAGVGPADVVRAENSHRRHLTPAQRAVIAVKHVEMLKHPGRPKQDKNVPRGTIKSSKDVAKEAGVSKRTVDQMIHRQRLLKL